MIKLTDTHCHIQSIGQVGGDQITSELWARLPGVDIDSIVAGASSNEVSRLIVVGCHLVDSQLAIKCAATRTNIWASIGIHPHEANSYVNEPAKLKDFSKLVNEPKVVAIGECGLDYHYNHSDPIAQQKILRFHLDLAQDSDLPVVFHVRDAFEDFWPILDDYPNIRGVLHSFTDSMDNLNEAIKRGLFIGVNGIATFTKDPVQTEVYKTIPVENLVLESDSPFLTPSPLRGKINEPKNVRLVAEYMASLREQPLSDIAAQTTSNARLLFGI